MSFDRAPGKRILEESPSERPAPDVEAPARIGWRGLVAALRRNRRSLAVSGSLLFAASPLVAWAASSAAEHEPPLAASPTSDIAPAGPETGIQARETPLYATSEQHHATRNATQDLVGLANGMIKPGDGCHPSYSGCVPIAVDVDCIGADIADGTGPRNDGPAYVAGPLLLVGADLYELDTNSDLIGCYDGDR